MGSTFGKHKTVKLGKRTNRTSARALRRWAERQKAMLVKENED